MHVSVKREIDRPAEEVFAFFADASNNPEWQKGMESCNWISDPPIGVGSTYRQKARFLGREVVSTFEVTGFESGRVIQIQTIESTFPIRVSRRVDPTGRETCRVRAEISGGPDKGILVFLGPLMASLARRSIERDYDRVVELLESASSEVTENSPTE